MIKSVRIIQFFMAVALSCPYITSINNQHSTTLFITGGAGFIGSNFLEYMFHKYSEYNFLVLDALTYAGNLDNIPEYIRQSPRFKFFYGSITNIQLVNTLMEQADFVVHFAAESHVTRSIDDDFQFFETDVMGTRVLLRSLVHHKKVRRFIHISTSEVCGTAEIKPMDEEHPIKPQSPYAAAKAGAERLVYAYQCTFDLPTVIVRFFNNYGPRQHTEKMLPRFITNALSGVPLTIHGSGTQTRDWLHTFDAARALDIILHHPQFDCIKNQLIHIGSGIEVSVLDMARLVLKNLGLSENSLTFVEDRPGQVAAHISSTKKAKALLNWEPTITLEEGIKQTIHWYQKNIEWWKKREEMRYSPVIINHSMVLQ